MSIEIEKKIEDRYEAFSLVEMLITIVIIGMVMLISSVTLTTLIKVSTVASNKIRARNESEFVLELVRRTVRNSDPSDVLIFSTQEARKFDFDNMAIVDTGLEDIESVYQEIGETEIGNEIHFRPYGYKDWICLAFFESSEDSEKGYILRTSAENLSGQHESCFGSTPYIIVLNSDYVDTNSFNIAYTVSNDGNYLIRFDIESEPVDWYLGSGAPIKRKVFRQGIVSTEGLIW
jgi:prepilin-type N-terminal cleavage/methylation domain-containing protein